MFQVSMQVEVKVFSYGVLVKECEERESKCLGSLAICLATVSYVVLVKECEERKSKCLGSLAICLATVS